MLLAAFVMPWAANAQTRDIATANFETGSIISLGTAFNGTVINNGAYPWVVTNDNNHTEGGSLCMKSNNWHVNNSTSSIELEVDFNEAGSISFYCWVSCESATSYYDYGIFYIDGVQKERFLKVNDWQYKTYQVTTPGTHVFKWAYTKDNADYGGQDCFYVDDITINGFYVPDCPKPTQVSVSNTTAHGATIAWNGDNDSYIVMVGEENADINADFETGDLSQTDFTSTTNQPWRVITNNHSGAYCAKSGNGGVNNSTSDLVLDVDFAKESVLTFSAKVSSEAGWDKAYFSIDGDNGIDAISGDGDWTDYTFTLAPGPHTLRWYYTKDDVSFSGDDCFYVDDIVISSVASWDESHIASASPYTFTDLDPETAYQVKVVGLCGEEQSEPSTTLRFSTEVSCSAPSGLTVSNVTAHSATVTWNAETGAQFQYCLSTVFPYTPSDEDFSTPTQNHSVSLHTLSSNTDYGFYLRKKCGNNDFSQIVAIVFHTESSCQAPTALAVVENSVTSNDATLSWTGYSDTYIVEYCAQSDVATVTEAMLSEGFEGGSIPAGWTSEGAATWTVGAGDYNSGSAHTGNYNAKITHGTTNGTTYLVTPAMDLSQALSASLNCYYMNRIWGGGIDDFGVYYRVDGGEWNELFSTNENHNRWTALSLDLTGLAANYQIGFKFTDHYGYGIAIDDILIEAESYDINWTVASNNANSPYTIHRLAAETTYMARVIGVCDGEYSDPSETVSFTTTEQIGIIQMAELVEGWNRFSTYIEVDNPIEMLDMLKAGLGDNGLFIESSDYSTEFDGEDWFGDLDNEGMVNEQMYLILTNAPCTVQLQGMPADPANHAITINPGWNRIGFPCTEAVEITIAFADFQAEEGDVLESADGQTEFDGEEWFGDLEAMIPGQGYLYYSNSTEPKTLVFRMEGKGRTTK